MFADVYQQELVIGVGEHFFDYLKQLPVGKRPQGIETINTLGYSRRMEQLLAYINSLPIMERELFADRCGTSLGYLRKACSIKQKLSEGMCLRIASESCGIVTLECLRPDVDWQYMRQALTVSAQEATKPIAA